MTLIGNDQLAISYFWIFVYNGHAYLKTDKRKRERVTERKGAKGGREEGRERTLSSFSSSRRFGDTTMLEDITRLCT